MQTNSMQKYAPIVVRIAVSLVVLWFGVQQLMYPSMWVGMLPSWTTMFGLAPTTLIYMNGISEIILGLLLLLGIWTRVVALLIALHLFKIVYIVGYSPIAVRDMGLALSAVSVFLHGRDEWSLDK